MLSSTSRRHFMAKKIYTNHFRIFNELKKTKYYCRKIRSLSLSIKHLFLDDRNYFHGNKFKTSCDLTSKASCCLKDGTFHVYIFNARLFCFLVFFIQTIRIKSKANWMAIQWYVTTNKYHSRSIFLDMYVDLYVN